MQPTARHRTGPHPRRRARLVRIGGAAVLMALAFSVATQSSSPRHDEALLADAVRRGADRLVQMQRRDGTWPQQLVGDGDLASSGRAARAVLAAHAVTRDPRHLESALMAARAMEPRIDEPRVGTPGNLLFLADLARRTGRADLSEAVRRSWAGRLAPGEEHDGARTAQRLLARPNPTGWTEGAWRNWLLSRAGEEADLARAVGRADWADQFLIEAATTWTPKTDHAFWASAAGNLLHALAASSAPEARRLRDVQEWTLRSNELIGGVPWNDTPYDTYVYAGETAMALGGAAANHPVDATESGYDAVRLLVARQSPQGGWGAILSLVDELAASGSGNIAPADFAEGETPEVNALVLGALCSAARPGRG